MPAVEDYAGNPGNNKGLLFQFNTNDQLKSDIYVYGKFKKLKVDEQQDVGRLSVEYKRH